MKRIATLFAIVMMMHHLQAQDSSNIKPNTVYAEAFGIGMRYSINYERYFGFKKNDFGFSLSGGIAPNFKEPKYLWFPMRLDANYEIGNSRIGAGINYMFGYYWYHSFIHPEDVNRSSDAYLFPNLSYYYLFKHNVEVSMRINFISSKWEDTQNVYAYLVYLPFEKLELYNKNFVMWPGLSIGYTF